MPRPYLTGRARVKYLCPVTIGRPDTFPAAATSVNYDLAGWLLQARKNGLSYREIARTLREDGLFVSHETIRKWCADLNGTKP